MAAREIIDDLRAWQGARDAAPVPALSFYATAPLPPCRKTKQHLDELEAYVAVLEGLTPKRVTLELGLYHGGTHFVWARLFDEVISLDNDYLLCCKAAVEFPASSSKIVYSDSGDPRTIRTLTDILAGRAVDHLFIDASHDYESVRAEFLAYAVFVRPGGIIGFHASFLIREGAGVGRFMGDLREGRVPGWAPIALRDIAHHMGAFSGKYEGKDYGLGISYFYKR